MYSDIIVLYVRVVFGRVLGAFGGAEMCMVFRLTLGKSSLLLGCARGSLFVCVLCRIREACSIGNVGF